MVGEIERTWLMSLAAACKTRGLSALEAHQRIAEEIRGFSTGFRIAQAVRATYEPMF